MFSHVTGQTSRLSEGHVTEDAMEWFISCMN